MGIILIPIYSDCYYADLLLSLFIGRKAIFRKSSSKGAWSDNMRWWGTLKSVLLQTWSSTSHHTTPNGLSPLVCNSDKIKLMKPHHFFLLIESEICFTKWYTIWAYLRYDLQVRDHGNKANIAMKQVKWIFWFSNTCKNYV